MPFTIDGEWIPSQNSDVKQKKITVRIQKKKGRILTVISNVKDNQKEQLFKELKGRCHCGGSVQKEQLELQGDHQSMVKTILKQKGLL